MNKTERPRSYLTPLRVRARLSRPQPQGLPVINMAFNELPYPPGEQVRAAIAQACTRVNRYGDPTCSALQAEICQRYGLESATIICGNGSEELLDVIARNFVQPGDEIVISRFGYIQFALTANRLNASLSKAPESDYCADVDALLETISPATRLVFLANPNNPTGTLLPESEIERLLDHIPPQVVLVLDLAYGEFVSADYCARMHALLGRYENLVVTRTFSKAFALAGLRVGWCQAPAWMIPGFYAARGMGTVNAVAQAAALASLSELEQVGQRIAQTVAERERVAAALREINVITLPSRANFLLLRASGASEADTTALIDHLFDQAGILVNCAREAGLENFLRVSLSLPEHNDRLLESIADFLA